MDCQKVLDLLAADVTLDTDFQIHLYEALDSTNDKLSQLIREENAPPGTVVIAKTQSAGRGQRGRNGNQIWAGYIYH